MSTSGTYGRNYSIGGLSFVANSTITSPVASQWSVGLGAAKVGTLTTRTNNTDGTLTMNSGHGITTGQRLDIYWAGGSTYGATVGTVSGNSVPFTGGQGDNLPIATTAITAMVPVSEPIALTGNNAVGIGANCPAGGRVVFAAANNSTIFAVSLRTSTNPSYIWSSGDGGSNPLAGGTVSQVFLSHGDSVQTPTMTGAVQFS